MPQYVVMTNHEPNNCPSASTRVRDFARKSLGERLPVVAQEHGIQMVLAPLHLDPGHKVVAVVDGPSIEAVCNFVRDCGLAHFNDVEVFPTTPVAELMERESEMLFD